MTTFIQLRALNHLNEANDFDWYVNPETISGIHSATPHDKNQREEINAIVMCGNNGMAVKEYPEQIIAKITEAEL